MLTPGTRLGPYEIYSAIGAGGMGEVYKARDTRLDRTVAFKILSESRAADPQFRERFDREARASGPLGGPRGARSVPAISPDGRWIAYRAAADDGTGRLEVFLARFPGGNGRVQVTSTGGGLPFWSRKGDELFFEGPPAGELYRVPVALTADRAQIGAPQVVFRVPNDLSIMAASLDGTRFLAIKEPRIDPPREIVVVEQWFDELRRVAPIQ